jgi:hypothetical protein
MLIRPDSAFGRSSTAISRDVMRLSGDGTLNPEIAHKSQHVVPTWT